MLASTGIGRPGHHRGLVDQDELSFERLSSTSSSTISASTRHGSVRRTVPSGVNSWRQLCHAKDAPPDDDDDEYWKPRERGWAERARNEMHRGVQLYVGQSSVG